MTGLISLLPRIHVPFLARGLSERQADNLFYTTHCCRCRRPLPKEMAQVSVPMWVDDPDADMRLYCDGCAMK